MERTAVRQLAERVSELLEEKLAVSGKTIDARVARAGRLLPRKVRRAAKEMARANKMTRSPKLLMQIDPEKVTRAYDTCVKYLTKVDPKKRGADFRMGLLASIGQKILIVGALVVAVLVWRGFV